MNEIIIGLLIVLSVAGLAAWRIAAGKAVDRPVKIMIFVGYFWLLAFVQLTLFAVIHFIQLHYS
ncbi:MAG: hypothetical protein PHW13_04575 [Methylococcales bacterium]|nr:hypothetical protein [Methylococcales bacterium]